MDVTLTNYEYGPGAGGGGVFTESLADALTPEHDVTVVADTREDSTADARQLVTWPARSLPALARQARAADVVNAHFAVPTATALPPVRWATGTPLVVNLMGADVYDPTRYGRIRPALDVVAHSWVGRAADRLVVPSTDMATRIPTRNT